MSKNTPIIAAAVVLAVARRDGIRQAAIEHNRLVMRDGGEFADLGANRFYSLTDVGVVQHAREYLQIVGRDVEAVTIAQVWFDLSDEKIVADETLISALEAELETAYGRQDS